MKAVQGIFLGNGVRIEWVSAELNICGLCQSETNTRDGPNASGVRGLTGCCEEVWTLCWLLSDSARLRLG